MADTVRVRFTGDESDLVKSFDKVGDEAKEMGRDIDRAASDTGTGLGRLGDGADASEQKFIGLRDSITGTGDIMNGFREGNIVMMLTGFADLASGIYQFVVPALKTFATTLKTTLASALTTISAHPLMAAILIGGAIIVGLVLLEKKFGLVSSAVDGIKAAMGAMWDFVRPILKRFAEMAQDVLDPIQGIKDAATGGGGKKGWLGGGQLFGGLFGHTGGVVPGASGMNVPMMLQAGETIVPRGSSRGQGGGVTIIVNGSVITERDLGRVVASALRDNGTRGGT